MANVDMLGTGETMNLTQEVCQRSRHLSERLNG